jgi:hypothetical protein
MWTRKTKIQPDSFGRQVVGDITYEFCSQDRKPWKERNWDYCGVTRDQLIEALLDIPATNFFFERDFPLDLTRHKIIATVSEQQEIFVHETTNAGIHIDYAYVRPKKQTFDELLNVSFGVTLHLTGRRESENRKKIFSSSAPYSSVLHPHGQIQAPEDAELIQVIFPGLLAVAAKLGFDAFRYTIPDRNRTRTMFSKTDDLPINVYGDYLKDYGAELSENRYTLVGEIDFLNPDTREQLASKNIVPTTKPPVVRDWLRLEPPHRPHIQRDWLRVMGLSTKPNWPPEPAN